MIQVENLVKKYGGHTAVDHLSFTVDKGQIYGFLGPNGAGKSTTMNAITGYIAADGGMVKINGYDIVKEPEKAKQCIGYLPEAAPLYAEMTVEEYLLYVAELKRVARKARKEHVQEIIGKMQLLEMKDRLIRNLSKGYKQRVGLAQALIGDPEVLILDEPMVGLDPKQIIEIRDLIKSLSGKHTVILSSHILSEVSAVCDHILIITKGRLAAGGSPEELQEMMHAKAEFEVTVLGEEEQAEAVLRNMGQIASCHISPGQEEGTVKIVTDAVDNVDIRKELSVALSGAGLVILSMNRLEKSLEDIFLELTKEDADQGEKGTDVLEGIQGMELEGLKEEKDLEKDDLATEGCPGRENTPGGEAADHDSDL